MCFFIFISFYFSLDFIYFYFKFNYFKLNNLFQLVAKITIHVLNLVFILFQNFIPMNTIFFYNFSFDKQ